MSLIERIVSKIPTINVNDIKARQYGIINQMKAIAENIAKIDKKSGEELLAYLGTVSINAIGVPISIPPKFGYAVAGFPLGIFLLTAKIIKLRPYYSELKKLQEQFDANVKLLQSYEQAAISAGIKDLETKGAGTTPVQNFDANTGTTTNITTADKIATATGLDSIARSAGVSNDTLVYVLGAIVIFIIYRKTQTKKRK